MKLAGATAVTNTDPVLPMSAGLNAIVLTTVAIDAVMTPLVTPVVETLNGFALKVAKTLLLALILTVHAPGPVQSPLQPTNVAPAPGVALKVTKAFSKNWALQNVTQLMPLGVLLTVPAPVPNTETDRPRNAVAPPKFAVTFFDAVMLTVQLPVPVQSPLQPMNVDPGSSATVSVTLVPLANDALQALPQLMAAGALVAVPEPVPDLVTVRP